MRSVNGFTRRDLNKKYVYEEKAASVKENTSRCLGTTPEEDC